MIPIAINGHFRHQVVKGVQRYAYEIIREFGRQNRSYRYVDPPATLSSNEVHQLWMQGVLPLKLNRNELLWSPTNIGPVFCKKQVITLHDIADRLYPHWFNDRYIQWRDFILPPLLKRVKGIITVSKYSRETIIEQFPGTKNKITVIYNGVQTDHFYPRPTEETEGLREEFGLHKSFVITVGSLDPRKNIEGLLKAWNQLPPDTRKETELVVVGGRGQSIAFQVEEEIDDSVRFLGYVRDEALPGLYSAARAFVYPSLFEGFGLPVLEAMACRTPVITSNTTSLKELADQNALTVDPRKTNEITDALVEIIDSDDLREQLTARGYEYAQDFQWSKSAEKTYAFLQQI